MPINQRDMYLVGSRLLLLEMLCFLVYIYSLNLVLAYLSPSAVGLAWDATSGGGGGGGAGQTGQPPHDLMYLDLRHALCH